MPSPTRPPVSLQLAYAKSDNAAQSAEISRLLDIIEELKTIIRRTPARPAQAASAVPQPYRLSPTSQVPFCLSSLSVPSLQKLVRTVALASRNEYIFFANKIQFFANFVAFSPSGVSFSPSGVQSLRSQVSGSMIHFFPSTKMHFFPTVDFLPTFSQ